VVRPLGICDVERLMKQYSKVAAMEEIGRVRSRKTWYSEWLTLMYTHLGNCRTGKASTREALDKIAAGLKEPRKKD